MTAQQAIKALRQTPAVPGSVNPDTFKDEGTTSAATSSSRTQIAQLKAKAPLAVRGGQRFQVALPAYEKFTTNSTAGDAETFNLSHSITQTPNTENIVVWENGTYVGNGNALDSVDYANDTFGYTDDGTGNSLHVWYVSDASADLELQKVTSSQNSTQGLYNENLRLVHNTNQSEQPETPDVRKTPLNPVIATDMEVEVYIEADYTFRWEDPDGDGAVPTNLLFSYPVNRAKGHVEGLADAVAGDMSRADA